MHHPLLKLEGGGHGTTVCSWAVLWADRSLHPVKQSPNTSPGQESVQLQAHPTGQRCHGNREWDHLSWGWASEDGPFMHVPMVTEGPGVEMHRRM